MFLKHSIRAAFLLLILQQLSIFTTTITTTAQTTNSNQNHNLTTDLIEQNGINDPAMGLFYKFNNYLISFLSVRPFPHEVLVDSNLTSLKQDLMVYSLSEKKFQWLEYERNWLIVAAVVIITSAIFTLIYSCYRLCLCCCCRTKKEERVDGRFDGCKRFLWNVILTVFVLINIFAAVALLLCSQYVSMSVEKVPEAINYVTIDLMTYLNHTERDVNNMITDEKHDLKVKVIDRLNSAADYLTSKSNASFSSLRVLSELDNIKKSFEFFKNIDQFNEDVERDLNILRNRAEQVKEYLPGNQVPEINFTLDNKLNDLKNFNSALESLEGPIKELEKLKNSIKNNVEKTINDVEVKIDEALQDSSRITDQVSEFSNQARGPIVELSKVGERARLELNRNKNYIDIAWYASLFISAILFFIGLCFLFGVSYGFCGNRASYYNNDCCVKPTGSKFYGCGIGLAVMLMFILAVVSCAFMFIMVPISEFICDPIRHPNERSDLINFADKLIYEATENSVHDDRRFPNISINRIIKGCQQDETFFKMLNMEKKVLNQLDFNELDRTLDNVKSRLVEALGSYHFDNRKIPDLQEKIKSLAELQKNGIKLIPTDDLDKILEKIKEVEQSPTSQNIKEPLEEVKHVTERLRAKAVIVNNNIEALKEIPSLDQIEFALNSLQNDPVKTIENDIFATANSLIKDIKADVQTIIEKLRTRLNNEITSCKPVKKIVSNAELAFCGHLVDPLNGIWMSIMISVILFVPLILIATKLSGLYQHTAFTKYTVHEPNTEATFSTDGYIFKPSNHPYAAANNYAYQETYPPPQLHYRY